MNPETIPGFDCLEFKWKVQSDIFEKTKNMTIEEQIAFFRHAAEAGPFADLVRAVHAQAGARMSDGIAARSSPSDK